MILPPHVLELIELAVAAHTASGGTNAAQLRQLLIGSHEIAHLDGQLEGINRIGAGIETHQAIQRAKA